MISTLNNLFTDIKFGSPQVYSNLTIVPIIHEKPNKIEYISLNKALEDNLIEITEVNDSGHVTELKAVNKSDYYILIIDGEQFIGAKQNRIINASILLDKKSQTIINVACVEEGRWSYKSKKFSDSDFMIDSNIRAKKMKSIHKNLAFSKTFAADQGEIWDEVHKINYCQSFNSPTSSINDLFEAKKSLLKSYSSTFLQKKGQKGFLVFINGQISGLEYISNSEMFSDNFEKMINSYSATALFNNKVTYDEHDYIHESKEFIKKITSSKENKYKSVGIGDDYRYESSSINASALIVDDEPIHLLGFTVNPDEKKRGRNIFM